MNLLFNIFTRNLKCTHKCVLSICSNAGVRYKGLTDLILCLLCLKDRTAFDDKFNFMTDNRMEASNIR